MTRLVRDLLTLSILDNQRSGPKQNIFLDELVIDVADRLAVAAQQGCSRASLPDGCP